MANITQLLSEPTTTIAVVGATDDPAKTGSEIYRDLKAKGYTVFAVNPGRSTVDGDPAYASLADLPQRPTIVDLVIPPAQTLAVLKKCHELGLLNVWVQPGAEDEEVLAYLDSNGFNHLTNACIMVRSRPLA